MTAITMIIAALGSGLVILAQPIWGLIIYITLLAWYPSYLKVSLSGIDFSVGRIIILAVFLRILMHSELLSRFRLNTADKLIIVYFAAQTVAGMFTESEFNAFIVNRGGAAFDMALPYFAFRIVVCSAQDYRKLFKGILFTLGPLAMIGLYQSFTGVNPFGFMQKFASTGRLPDYTPLPRHGFYRANLTFGVSIMSGLFFAMLGTAAIGLIPAKDSPARRWWLIGLICMAAGVFSSISSGSWLVGMVAVMFVFFYPYRKYWRGALFAIVMLLLSVEIYSNRNFYDVLGSFTLNPRSAWYRAQLIEVALFKGGMEDHWLAGYGHEDPGWSKQIDNRDHTDMVNHYLMVLSRYGLLGLIPFMALLYFVLKYLYLAFQMARNFAGKFMVWGLTGAILGTMATFFSCSLFSQPSTAFYVLLALGASMPTIVARSEFARRRAFFEEHKRMLAMTQDTGASKVPAQQTV
ncbi:Lipid A core - O-antigen ligase [Anaerohalosphaera lusitana]|uniref:Lipid A core-O-antigen ligase n=1 Tax=Anaerohalosphaera lusitana TaxID=1936003 RepID=A0A1U9NNC7_9BACT|nr:O-antigen ligase family protein [Anaerohalosphaera lusitana]AQT69452.1 Lipid A core - O-antigen ligase [Anaerohalosphaera lusitana]